MLAVFGTDRPPPTEATRLRSALATAANDLTQLADQTTKRAGEEVGAIFEAQALFARDPGHRRTGVRPGR